MLINSPRSGTIGATKGGFGHGGV